MQHYNYSGPVLRAIQDYRNPNGDRRVLAARFLVECGEKMGAKPLTSSTACVFYHRFYSEEGVDNSEYDEFLIAAATLYLAGKVKDEPLKIRDLVHVVHCTLNRNAELPDKEDDFWLIRDSIVQAELLITRMLKFDFNVIHPHKYMLHFMKVLQDWFGSSVWNSMPIAKTAAGFVQDFHQSPAILLYKPSHIAICCLSLAFQIYGVQVPVRSDQEVDADLWYTVFVGEDLIKDKHWEICEAILAIYDEHKDGLTRHSFSTGQISA